MCDWFDTYSCDLLTPTGMYHLKVQELCSCLGFHVKWSLLVWNKNRFNDFCEISNKENTFYSSLKKLIYWPSYLCLFCDMYAKSIKSKQHLKLTNIRLAQQARKPRSLCCSILPRIPKSGMHYSDTRPAKTCRRPGQAKHLASFTPIFFKHLQRRTGLVNLSEGACQNCW